MNLDDTARAIIRDDTPLIEPGRLAHLDQVAAALRDESPDAGREVLADALDALDRCEPGEEIALSDLAYVGALLVVSEPE